MTHQSRIWRASRFVPMQFERTVSGTGNCYMYSALKLLKTYIDHHLMPSPAAWRNTQPHHSRIWVDSNISWEALRANGRFLPNNEFNSFRDNCTIWSPDSVEALFRWKVLRNQDFLIANDFYKFQIYVALFHRSKIKVARYVWAHYKKWSDQI